MIIARHLMFVSSSTFARTSVPEEKCLGVLSRQIKPLSCVNFRNDIRFCDDLNARLDLGRSTREKGGGFF